MQQEERATMGDKPDSNVFFTQDLVTPTGSSSSSGSSTAIARRRAHSGELLMESAEPKTSKPSHRRSGSGALFYNPHPHSSSTATSPSANHLPAGNICPSGRIGRSHSTSSPRSDVLGSGSGSYGHGSVVRAGGSGPLRGPRPDRAMASPSEPEEVKRVGNEMYRKGQFAEALMIYDRAISMRPENAAYRTNRAAALAGLKRFREAVRDCEEALKIDPRFVRAHQRLASLHLRLAEIENSQKHLFLASEQQQPDAKELQRLQALERHLGRCADARKIGDWKSAMREADSVVAAGADSSPLVISARAEALLRLHQLDEADSAISDAIRLESLSPSCSKIKFFGMLSTSFMHIVRAQVEMALGRFENAVGAAERARLIDPGNVEITMVFNNVRLVARAREQGNELFNAGKFCDACIAYGEGLMYDPSNPVLYCNRAACRSKLGHWEKAVEDCNAALKIKPNYTKALLRRAESYSKLERWIECVQDYEVLRNELQGDDKVAEALLNAQALLKKSRGEEISKMKFGGEVEVISDLNQFHAAITLPGVSVVHFMVASNQHCIQINPFVGVLCHRYPSVNFLKVDVNETTAVCKAENVKAVPTFKIYKNGTRVKEMICPSHQLLELAVRHYGL